MSRVDFWCILEGIAVILLLFYSILLKFPKDMIKQLFWWTLINVTINIIFVHYL